VTDANGNILSIQSDSEPRATDIQLGTAVPGYGNAHSHSFHRALRGRTHSAGGDFWVWREAMYRAAAQLDPVTYYELARATFAEMLVSGYTAVGEFHYVHHRPDGASYDHEMEIALVEAAAGVGIRITLLDTAYLTGGVGLPLSPEQVRFSDREASQYLDRWYELRTRIPTLGAAIHSVRAVPPEAISMIVAGLPDSVPLHVHLSEQPQENVDALSAYGLTPTALLAERGVVTSRLTAVHATHLTDDDIKMLGDAGATVVMCPTTEADLGDGVGPARRLKDAGAVIAIGSDQNAVIDPFLEVRALELHERLASRQRGRFDPRELAAVGSAGYRALGMSQPGVVGGPCDFVEIDCSSMRTLGAIDHGVLFGASPADVQKVVVGGVVRATNGQLRNGDDPAHLLWLALDALS
jgi:formiminoglutamate deiminase